MENKDNQKQSKKSFVWITARIGFYSMISSFFLLILLPETDPNTPIIFLSIIYQWSILLSLVTSIIHLTKYKEKGLAITSLVISSILFLSYLSYL